MNATLRSTTIGATLALLLAGCTLGTQHDLGALRGPEVISPRVNIGTSQSTDTEPQLYARDGSVVTGHQPGTVKTGSQNRHEVGDTDGSRMYMLELYQKELEKSEQLELEVRSLMASLKQREATIADLELTQAALQTKVATLEGEVETMHNDNLDLAGRLTTAQIRRLQAEKLLLEAKIDWQRVQVMMQDGKGGQPQPAGMPLGDEGAGGAQQP